MWSCTRGSFVSKGTSVFANKLEQLVASPLINCTDDGTMINEWGTTNIDDEGTFRHKRIYL